jgi:ZIP family zinc transporter
MIQTLQSISPILQALLATLFTRGVTAPGAATVFLTRSFHQKVLDWMPGFTVMMVLDIALG